MSKEKKNFLLLLTFFTVGVLLTGAGTIQAKKKVRVKRYSVEVQKGTAYTVAALEEDLEALTSVQSVFPISVASKDLTWKANSKNVKVKGSVFTIKKKGTYKLTGTYTKKKNKKYKKYKNYKYVITVKSVSKKKAAIEEYAVEVEAGKTYNIKTIEQDEYVVRSGMLSHIASKQKLIWKSSDKNLIVKGNKVTANQPGTYQLTGYSKYNTLHRYVLTFNVHTAQFNTNFVGVKRIVISQMGKNVEVTDPAKITEFCNKFASITYTFDYTAANQRQEGFYYSVAIYGDSEAPMCEFTTGKTVETIKIYRGTSYKTTDCSVFGDLLTSLYNE